MLIESDFSSQQQVAIPISLDKEFSLPHDGLDMVTRRPIQMQKEENFREMYRLTEGMSHQDHDLICSAIQTAFVCHANHLRLGTEAIHYSKHLLEVAKRVKENFVDFSETFQTPAGTPISALAVAITVALLHDSKEDIGITYSHMQDRKVSDPLVEQLIRARLARSLDEVGIKRVCGAIDKLSIKNPLDIPDSSYVRTIRNDSLTEQIKAADVDHNMDTMDEIGPNSAAIIFACQYASLMAASPYANAFVEKMLTCLEKAEFDINLSREAVTWGEIHIARLMSLEGEVVGPKLSDFYAKLYNYAALKGIPDKSLKNIERYYDCFSGIGCFESETNKFPIHKINTGDLSFNVLGPIRGWSAELRITAETAVLKDAILQTAMALKTNVSGFVVENDDNSVSFHMARLPTRAGESVPSSENYENFMFHVSGIVHNKGVISSIILNENTDSNSYQAIMPIGNSSIEELGKLLGDNIHVDNALLFSIENSGVSEAQGAVIIGDKNSDLPRRVTAAASALNQSELSLLIFSAIPTAYKLEFETS